MEDKAKRVMEWMEARPWYRQFVENLKNHPSTPGCRTPEELVGHCLRRNMDIIQNAFLWTRTPEGWSFWYKRNAELDGYMDDNNLWT